MIGTTHEECLMVFGTVRNLVEIGTTFSRCASFNAMRVWLENAYWCPFWRSFVGITVMVQDIFPIQRYFAKMSRHEMIQDIEY